VAGYFEESLELVEIHSQWPVVSGQ
jgi:hypothetical protein